MRITFILKHAYISGGDRVIATHARELMNRGHQVTVISTPWAQMGLKERIRNWLTGRTSKRPRGIVASSLDGTGVPHQITEKTRPIVEEDVPDGDVVVATWWETAEWVDKLSPAKGVKAYLIQGWESWGGNADRVDATWRLPLYKIVISRWLASIAREKFNDTDFAPVPNSVDMKQFNAPARGKQAVPTVGFVYSTIPLKGCDVILKALEIASRELPNLKVVSFGTVPVLSTLPLPADSQYTQKPPQDRIKDIYGSCDAWLIGSRAEGFGLPMLEAMACRTPVISTKVGGAMDAIENDRNGFLVDIEDSAELARRMTQVLKLSDAQWRQMSDAAYTSVCRYTWQDAAQLLEQALEATIVRSKAGRRTGV